MKKLFTLLIASLLLTACVNNEVKVIDTKTKTYCEQQLENGKDLNFSECMYSEMENGRQVLLYLPDNIVSERHLSEFNVLDYNVEKDENYNPYYRIRTYRTYVSEENDNPEYLMKVLNHYLFKKEEGFKIAPETTDDEIFVTLSSNSVQDYSITNSITGTDEIDLNGAAQVLYQAAADTIYANFPEVSAVVFTSNFFMDITPIEDGVYIDKNTLLPVLFGSKNNYIGNLSFEEYKAKLEESGVHFDNYYDHYQLKIVNNWVYNNYVNSLEN